jgi:hypothetical protein
MLALALHAVPQAADEVSFTNLSAVKRRLGYNHLTSESPAGKRLQFWRAVRRDGSLLTGTLLSNDSSAMARDYGWTGEDVDWEVDFASTEEGCQRSMLCETARGSVLGLRKDLDWIDVISSLIDNEFQQDQSQPSVWTTSDKQAPFTIVRLLPEVRAVAVGNAIGITRIGQVAAGAPSIAADVGRLAEQLSDAESVQLSPGCVTVEQAMGPDATDDDVSAYLRHHNVSQLLSATQSAVGTAGPRSARALVQLASAATSDDISLRTDLVSSWSSVHTGIAFRDVASVSASGSGDVESLAVDVHEADVFRDMVLTHDTPWALCLASPPR